MFSLHYLLILLIALEDLQFIFVKLSREMMTTKEKHVRKNLTYLFGFVINKKYIHVLRCPLPISQTGYDFQMI